MLNLIKPDWSAPKNIRAISTTRVGGKSLGRYKGLNLGAHVQDDFDLVQQNRSLLTDSLNLLPKQCWLNQTHSTDLINLDQNSITDQAADASWSSSKNKPCIVMTADCLPVLVTDIKGSFVCAIHAGWRGLCSGIIEKSIDKICNKENIDPKTLLVWLGPCIGKNSFEIGAEVRKEFMAHDPKSASAFIKHKDRWLADLHLLATLRLEKFNVAELTSSSHCTYSEPEQFYSYRRDGETGRMATIIWIE